MDWTAEAIERLKLLWTEGLSTAEIGRRLNISKNAVVGKVHRLALVARPSPIRRNPDAAALSRPAILHRIHGATLPPLGDAPGSVTPPRKDSRKDTGEPGRNGPQAGKGGAAKAAPDRALRTVPRVAPAMRPSQRNNSCCWPIGEPGTASFYFCGKTAVTGRPYCEAHAEIAYVRVRDRRENAA